MPDTTPVQIIMLIDAFPTQFSGSIGPVAYIQSKAVPIPVTAPRAIRPGRLMFNRFWMAPIINVNAMPATTVNIGP
jgi:hypothetical protein